MGNILSKAPCNSDLFEGQAHMKLAEVIANEIETDKKCTILGIDGGWGAGKSNLVGMIEKYLTNETAHPELKGIHGKRRGLYTSQYQDELYRPLRSL